MDSWQATPASPAGPAPDPHLILKPRNLSTGLQPEYVIVRLPATIGRHPTNDIELPFDSVSRYHARIELHRGRPHIVDLRSSNGTFVNGKRVQLAPIIDHDAIAFGSLDFTLVLPGSGEAEDSAQAVTPSEHTSVQFLQQDELEGQVYQTELPYAGDSKSRLIDRDLADAVQLKKAQRQLQCFYRLHEILNATADESKMLGRTLDLLFDVLPIDRGVLLARDEHDPSIYRPAAVRARQSGGPERIGISKTILQRCMRNRVAILTRDATRDQRFAASDSVHENHMRSMMCVPLISGHHVFGFVHVDTTESVRAFTEEDLSFLVNIGQEIAVHLHNLRMMHDRIVSERMTAIGQTITGLAHNIKNVLVLSQGGIEMMDKRLREKNYDALEETWKLARRGLDRINRMVQEMLDYSRARTVEKRRVQINEIVGELRNAFTEELRQRAIQCRLELDEDVPVLMLDQDGLEKALDNLILNAIEACETGGQGLLTLRTRLEPHGHVRIEVEDNGSGMPREILPRIFVPFFTTKGSKGSGLGLAMTKKFIEDMGGRIEVHSREGEGSRFTITLFLEQAAPRIEEATGGANQNAAPGAEGPAEAAR